MKTGILIIFGLSIAYSIYLRYLKKSNPDLLNTISKKLHWSSQILPPLILLMFFTTYGPGLLFVAGVIWIVGVISFISLLIKLINYKKNKRVVLRPIMAVLIAGIHFALVTYSVKIAEQETLEIAQNIEKECNLNMECPASIENWKDLKFKNGSTKVGNVIKYPVTYRTSGSKFTLHLHKSLDMGKNYSSGVKEALKVTSTF